MSIAEINVFTTDGRSKLVQSRLLGTLTRLFGKTPEEIPIEASLMELGADSLFLLQMSQVLRDEFGIKVPFRLLLDELSTVQALAGHLDKHLPESFGREAGANHGGISKSQQAEPEPGPERRVGAAAYVRSTTIQPLHAATQKVFEDNAKPVVLPAEPIIYAQGGVEPGPALSALTNGDAPLELTGTVGRLIEQQLRLSQEQLRLMAMQLELLRNGGHSVQPPVVDKPGVSSVKITPAAKAGISEPVKREAVQKKPSGGVKIEPAPFVAYEPLPRERSGGLTEQQNRHLQALIARINARTAGSKRITQEHRACLANNRATATFRQAWKEMVYPLIIQRGQGSHVWDVDNNEYIDLTMGFGALLFGHSPSFIIEAIQQQLSQGLQLGGHTALAGEAAELIRELTGVERVAFCNSGTEAVMGALRLARTVTGKSKVALFEGCYHGTFDGIMVRGEPVDNNRLRAVPMAPGVPPKMIEDVLLLKYGASESLEILKEHIHDLAAVLIEPPRSRRPDVQPQEFLQGLRKLTEEAGVALIFDEVVTGFRFHPGGAQAMFGIHADLVTYGKAIGGGFPVAVIAGKAAYMDAVDGGMWNYQDSSYPPADITFLTGTYFQHPLAMAALSAVLKHIKEQGPKLQESLAAKTTCIAEALNGYFAERHLPLRAAFMGSLFRLLHGPDLKYMDLFYYHLMEKGIFVCETRNCLLSTAHTDADVEHIIRAFKEVTDEMIEGGFLPVIDSGHSVPKDRADSGEPLVAAGAAAQRGAFRGQAKPVNGAEKQPSKRVPLTAEQKQIWALANMDAEGAVAYNQSMVLHLRGNLDVAVLARAFQMLVDRHEALRTTISPDGDYQELAGSLQIQVPLTDLASCPESDRKSELKKLLQSESRHSFDLLRGPVFRALLVRFAANDYFLSITAHHVVFDGWSMGIILRELKELYAAEHSGRKPSLQPADNYSDYVQAETTREKDNETQMAEAYWMGQFAGRLSTLNLPSDHPRSGVQSFVGAQDRIPLEAALHPQLKRLSSSQGCTMFMVLLAAFKVLLHHLTGQEDIIVGTPSAGQMLAERHNLVGYCVGLLPLRSRVSSVMPFSHYLKHVKQVVGRAYEHQPYSYSRLLKRLTVSRDPARSPLVEVIFNLDSAQAVQTFGDMEMEILPNHSGSSKFDLTFDVTDHRTHFTLDCEYNTSLFTPPRAQTWMWQYETVLRLIVAAPDIKISQIRAQLRSLETKSYPTNGISSARSIADSRIATRRIIPAV